MSEPFIGEIRMVPYTFAPEGWIDCDGREVSIAEYDALYSLIGTTYGGNGITTFRVPDLRGRTPVHQGQGPGLPNVTLGAMGGAETVALQTTHLPTHTHTVNASSSPGSTTSPTNAHWAATGADPVYAPGADTLMDRIVTPSGYGEPHDNMPPYLVVRFIIAGWGIYPVAN